MNEWLVSQQERQFPDSIDLYPGNNNNKKNTGRRDHCKNWCSQAEIVVGRKGKGEVEKFSCFRLWFVVARLSHYE